VRPPTLPPVRRSLTAIAIVTVVAVTCAGASIAGAVPEGPEDDQRLADAAIAAFAERMTAAGGVADDFGSTDSEVAPPGSSPTAGPADTDPADADSGDPTLSEPAADPLTESSDALTESSSDDDSDPFTACLEGLDALYPDGEFDGETARAFSESFVFEPADQPDDSNDLLGFLDDDVAEAGVVYVEADQQQVLSDFVDNLVADDTVACLEDLMGALAAEGEPADSSEAGSASYESSVQAQSDLGIGDTSARLQFDVASVIDGTEFRLRTMVYVAQAGRSLAYVTVSVNGDIDADLDGAAELLAIVDSL